MDLKEKATVDTHRELIVDVLKAVDVLQYLVAESILSGPEAEEIASIEPNKKANETLLKKLESRRRPGWFQAFLRALKKSENELLEDILDGFCDVKKQNVFKNLIELFYIQLCEILPCDFCTPLLECGCLSDDDVDVITKADRKCRKLAVFKLLTDISRRKENWLEHFLRVMKENNCIQYKYLIENIEPKLEKAGVSVGDQLSRFATEQMGAFPESCDNPGAHASGSSEYGFTYTESCDMESLKAGNVTNQLDKLQISDNLNTATAKEETLNKEKDLPTAESISVDTGTNFNIPDISLSGGASNYAESVFSEENNQDIDDIVEGELILMPFQEELVGPSVRGENKIILAPTNSGKTFVAMAIVKKHFENDKPLNIGSCASPKKAIFLVPKVCLAKQQHRKFREYLPDCSSCHMTGRHEGDVERRVPLDMMLPCYDVIVMTPQILVDGLKDKNVTLQQISLLIFDECHLTQGGTPANAIMKHYLQDKIENDVKNLPQIVGLTASVGIGQLRKDSPLSGAIEHILKLCANLDCTLHTVRREKQSLEEYIKSKKKMSIPVKPKEYDPFFQAVRAMMLEIQARDKQLGEEYSESLTLMQLGERKAAFLFPDMGTLKYVQHITTMEHNVSYVPDRRAHVACLQYLKIYNRALMLNYDCQATDALLYIQRELQRIQAECSAQSDTTEEWLYRMFQGKLKTLESIGEIQKNPKLERMKEIVLDRLIGKPEARALILVMTRELTIGIERYLRNDFDMRDNRLTVGRFVGGGASQDKAGMSTAELKITLDKFRDGELRILVATSVVEMGLDIPDCSLVINYERSLDEVSKVQSEGRARAENALVVILGQADKQILEKDGINERKVQLMHEAVEAIYTMAGATCANIIKRFQQDVVREVKKKRQMEQYEKASKVASAGRYRLLCLKCNAFVCNVEDIRVVKGAHHVVTCPDFNDRVDYKPHKKQCYMSDSLYKTHKIHCRKCNLEWGVKSVYLETDVPIVKQGSFIIDEDNGKHLMALTKWSDLRCELKEARLEDMQALYEAAFPRASQD